MSLDKPSDELSWDDTLTPSNLSVTVRFYSSADPLASEHSPLPSCLRLGTSGNYDSDGVCASEVRSLWQWEHKVKPGEQTLLHTISANDVTAIADDAASIAEDEGVRRESRNNTVWWDICVRDGGGRDKANSSRSSSSIFFNNRRNRSRGFNRESISKSNFRDINKP